MFLFLFKKKKTYCSELQLSFRSYLSPFSFKTNVCNYKHVPLDNYNCYNYGKLVISFSSLKNFTHVLPAKPLAYRPFNVAVSNTRICKLVSWVYAKNTQLHEYCHFLTFSLSFDTLLYM